VSGHLGLCRVLVPRAGTSTRVELAVWQERPINATIPCMPPTVLIVDDHPSFRVTARALLEAEGFDVVGEAEDGETALEEAARLHPEVVLLDVQLPGIDGFEVAARLTSWNGASPAVVLTSSRDATEFSGLVERSGARGFVAKAELSAAALTALLK
jgi:DNA-binding NarL/FixJ family response regulator